VTRFAVGLAAARLVTGFGAARFATAFFATGFVALAVRVAVAFFATGFAAARVATAFLAAGLLAVFAAGFEAAFAAGRAAVFLAAGFRVFAAGLAAAFAADFLVTVVRVPDLAVRVAATFEDFAAALEMEARATTDLGASEPSSEPELPSSLLPLSLLSPPSRLVPTPGRTVRWLSVEYQPEPLKTIEGAPNRRCAGLPHFSQGWSGGAPNDSCFS